MQLIITDAWLAKTRAIQLSGRRLLGAFVLLSAVIAIVAAGIYHWVFLKGAREGWPVIGSFVRLLVKDEFAQRDRYLRENLDIMAKKIGEMQAKLTQLESLGERVSGLAGINPAEIKVVPGRGGLLLGDRAMSLEDIQNEIGALSGNMQQRNDALAKLEADLFERKMRNMLVPTQHPVEGSNLGSHFGWRVDPFTGHSALHAGLDFQADPGTKIVAAAGGVVVTQEWHPGYGNLVEIDHGKDVVTRYAHSSQVFVKKGDLVRRGQKIAEVGSTGRSTGPHLHFEVLVQGLPHDPLIFLQAGDDAVRQFAKAEVAAAKANARTNSAQSGKATAKSVTVLTR
jgi:murein DD-endopeptidase MepM/ murein hydrolase activator NlpD